MITDSYGRRFKKLRVSLLNTCNFACTYCAPERYDWRNNADHTGQWGLKHENEEKVPLSFRELRDIIGHLHRDLQLNEIQLTGGEPLLYPRIVSLVEFLYNLGIPTIKLTTNGLYLARYGHQLEKAGITGINISLDAVDQTIFQQITGRNHLNKVLEGIDNLLDTDVELKLNAVIMKNVNDDQVIPLLEYSRHKSITLRYVELMNMGHLYENANDYFFSAHDILDTISAYSPLTPQGRDPSGTANYWKTQDGYQFGIIANETFPFCNDCNRLRLDSQGKLYGCITAQQGIDAKNALHPEDYRTLLEKAIAQKQPAKFTGSAVSMLHLGG